MLQLADISHFQKVDDWKAFTSGLSGVLCKATDGLTFTDPTLESSMEQIKALGLVPGAYHFLRPWDEPRAQARAYIASVQKFFPLIPAVDIEESQPDPTKPEQWGQMKNDLRCQVVLDFLSELGANLIGLPHIYGEKEFFDSYLQGLDLSAWPTWVCDDKPGATFPRLPSLISNWSIWQYKVAPMAGVEGGVDHDYFNGDLTQLRSLMCNIKE